MRQMTGELDKCWFVWLGVARFAENNKPVTASSCDSGHGGVAADVAVTSTNDTVSSSADNVV